MKNKLVHYEIFIFDLSKMCKTMNIVYGKIRGLTYFGQFYYIEDIYFWG